MPNRIIRDGILGSERVNQLDHAAEVFYRRLMSKVDDHGLYDARPSMLRATLYPLRVDRVREADISRWMAICQKAGLIVLYEAEGKHYLKMLNTHWQTRSLPKYPAPPASNCAQLITTEHLDVVVDVGVVVVSPNGDMSGDKPPDVALLGEKPKINGASATAGYLADAESVLVYLNNAAGKDFQFRNPKGKLTASAAKIIERLKEGYTATQMREVVFFKAEEWRSNDDMHMYLRPETLFRKTNFEQYIGAIGTHHG